MSFLSAKKSLKKEEREKGYTTQTTSFRDSGQFKF